MRSSYKDTEIPDKKSLSDIHPFLTLKFQDPPKVTAIQPEAIRMEERKKVEKKAKEEDKTSHAARVSEQILAEAREQAAIILKDARKEAEDIRKKAHLEGYKEGFEEGKNAGQVEGKEEFEKAIQETEVENIKAIQKLEDAKNAILKKYLGTLRDISLTVAEKVIQVSLASSSEIILRMIAAEAEKHRKTAWIKIYIDKEDYDMIAKEGGDLAGVLSDISENIKFVVMDKESRGYLIMETPEEVIDMSVKTQVENVKSRLKEVTIEDEDIDV